jgi:hypothetical protein
MLRQVRVWVRHPQQVKLGAIQERFTAEGVRVVGHPRRGDAEIGDAVVCDAGLLMKDLAAVDAVVQAKEGEDGVAASVAIEFDREKTGDEAEGGSSQGFAGRFGLTAQAISPMQKEFLAKLAEAISAAGDGETEQ